MPRIIRARSPWPRPASAARRTCSGSCSAPRPEWTWCMCRIGPAVVDLLGGQVQAYFGTFPSTIEQVRAGKLRALAVTSPTRAAVLPDVPAMAEFLPGFEASIYVGLAAPRDTPAAIIDTLGSTLSRALDDPQIARRIADFGDVPLRLSPAAFTKLVADETEKWAEVIRAGHIKAE